jgi:ABC-2 type transport system ATP-binding protein
MKTLSFDRFRAGRGGNALIDLDSKRDGLSLSSGLHVLVAPNGAGKSTWLQTLSGILPPLEGRALLDGQTLRPAEDLLAISEYLSFPKYILPTEWIGWQSRVEHLPDLSGWITRLSMESKINRYLGTLSQGERRKVTWLAAHASDSPLLLMDEPLDGLDLLSLEAVREMLIEWKSRSRIIIVISHHVAEILDLADHVYFLSQKRLVRLSSHTDPIALRREAVQFYLSR